MEKPKQKQCDILPKNWIYKGEIFQPEHSDGSVAFVYLITNQETGRKYIGKKFFWVKKTRVINGKKKREMVHSDWQTYMGSSKTLEEDIKKYGLQAFDREILHLCENKVTAAYMELVEQVERKVLETDEYYNGFIGGKINGKGLKPSR